MKKIKISLIVIFLGLLFYSCQKEMMDYSGVSGIYFNMQVVPISNYGDSSVWERKDTTVLPFSTIIKDDSVYTLKFMVIGAVKDYDRKFKFQIVDSMTTAVEGRDFDKIDDYYIVPAGKERAFVPITFYRTPEMHKKHLYVTFKLVPTNDFALPMSQWRPTDESYNTKDAVSVIYHTVDVSDVVSPPRIWTTTIWGDGEFSVYKFTTVCAFFGLTELDFMDRNVMPMQRETYLGLMFNKYLQQKEKEGNPIYERDVNGEILYKKNADGSFELDEDGNKIPVKMELGWLVNE